MPRYSYYQPECPAGTCKPDVGPPGKTFLWQRNPPYARAYATAGKFGTQWGIGYTGAPPVPPVCYDKNVVCAPPTLLNSVQETYMQRQVSNSNPKYFANGCIQCHALATTVGTNQKPADFSFLLSRVHVPK